MMSNPEKVTVEEPICIGSGSCARLAPGWFRMDEARGVAVVTDDVDGRDPDRLELAERTCPVGAIIIEST